MNDDKITHNHVVWVDIPVVDLERSIQFYSEVLGIEIEKESFDEISFGVFYHQEGNGACLVPSEKEVSSTQGILVYMNVDGRIQDAVEKVEGLGGNVLQPIHSIGPHGFRALVLDSEGNRLALHSHSDQ